MFWVIVVEPSVTNFRLSTDAATWPSGDSLGAVSLHWRKNRPRIKIIALLGPTKPQVAELLAGVVGLEIARSLCPSETRASLEWETDSHYVCEAMECLVQGRIEDLSSRIGHSVHDGAEIYWKGLDVLRADFDLKMRQVKGHSGVRRNEQCHRACKWLLRDPRLASRTLHGEALGMSSKKIKDVAWRLLDLRETLVTLSQEQSSSDYRVSLFEEPRPEGGICQDDMLVVNRLLAGLRERCSIVSGDNKIEFVY